LTLEVRTL